MTHYMNRRSFISAAFAMLAIPASGAARNTHPFSGLINLKGESFEPDDHFAMVLTMTAADLYQDCAGAFLSVNHLVESEMASGKVKKYLIMPKPINQENPKDWTNIKAAHHYGFEILTGDLAQVRSSAERLGAEFKTNSKNKVIEHGLDAFFLTSSGTKLFQHYAQDFQTMQPLMESLLKRCSSILAPVLCR